MAGHKLLTLNSEKVLIGSFDDLASEGKEGIEDEMETLVDAPDLG